MLLHRKGKKLKILAFDTCLDKTYITLSEDDKIIHSETILSDGKNYHSAYLISTIVKILKDAGLTPDDIELITTDIGPGSFTGIRACTTVARVLAQQLNIKAAGVSSLEILSKILGGNDLVALDARKNKAYVYDGKILGAIELEEVDEVEDDVEEELEEVVGFTVLQLVSKATIPNVNNLYPFFMLFYHKLIFH